jgi:hypothetical protein
MNPRDREEKAMFEAAVLRRENQLLRQLVTVILEDAVVVNPSGPTNGGQRHDRA